MKAAVVAAVLVGGVALAAPLAARAASPEPSPVMGVAVEAVNYWDEEAGRVLLVQNTSNVEAEFTITPSGGWEVSPDTLVLAPEEQAAVSITEPGRVDGAEIEVRGVATSAVPAGHSQSVMLLTSRIYLERPFDWVPVVLLALFLIVATVTAFAVIRRGRRTPAPTRRTRPVQQATRVVGKGW